MKTLLIENPQEAIMFTTQNKNVELYDGVLDQHTVEEVATDIKERYADDTGVYIININVLIGGCNYSDNVGIRLLKLLRLNHINSHVALYSQLSRETLLTQIDIRNAIVYSKGVSYHHVLNLRDLSQLDFQSLSRFKADPKELLLLFRAEYDPDDSHFNANMFGVWQLMKVQDAYEALSNENNLTQDPVQSELQDSIEKYLNSYNGLLVQYISGQGNENVKEALLKATAEREKKACLEIIQQTTKDIDAATLELKDLELQANAIRSLVNGCEIKKEENKDKTDALPEVLELFDRMDERAEKKLNELVGQRIGEYNIRKTELEEELQRLTELKEQAERSVNNLEIGPTMMNAIEVFTDDKVADVHKALNGRAPHVVYVDDMATAGWSNVLCRIIYNDPDDYTNLCYVAPNDDDDTQTIIQNIIEAFKTLGTVDLLILDLRLKKNERGYVNPKELSGFKVLERLHQINLKFPILVFTASNKVWSMKEAFKGNVMSFWTKGGLEQLDNENAYVNNYLDLVDQINSLTKLRCVFELLHELRKMAREIAETKDPFWWEFLEAEFEYRNNDSIKIYHRKLTDKEVVISNLNLVVEYTQNSLRQMYFQTSNITLSDVYHMMVIQLSYIVEEVLSCKESLEDPFNISYKIKVCLPEAEIWRLTVLRNSAAHHRSSQITEKKLLGYIFGIKRLLFYTFSGSSDKSSQNANNETETITSIDSGQEELTGRQLTPVDERLDRLARKETITVEVKETSLLYYPNHYAYLFDFFVDDDKQLKKSAVLLSDDVEDQKYIGKIKIGDVINVKRKKQRLRIVGHYKASEFFEADDKLSPDQGSEQELSNESEENKEEKK